MLVVIRGAGDIASGIALRLHRAGMQVVMCDRAVPTSIRRTVCFSEAIRLGETSVEGVRGVLCADDVLLFSSGVPKKRKMLAQHIEEFLQDLQADGDFAATVLPVGKGLAVARKERAS